VEGVGLPSSKGMTSSNNAANKTAVEVNDDGTTGQARTMNLKSMKKDGLTVQKGKNECKEESKIEEVILSCKS
jgi:hypothetical protein